MAFILELEFHSHQAYIKNYIAAIVNRFAIPSKITHKHFTIQCALESQHPQLQACLDSIAQTLPASLFLKSSKSYEAECELEEKASMTTEYPLNLALCPSCQKEMFEVSSKRYYYPFTSCSCCGANHSFITHYPYTREHTSFKFVVPCQSCQDEIKSVGFKEGHAINSCHECGVPVRLVSKNSERYANDAGSFRTMFEVAAKALNDNKKLLVKTTMGYRLFYKTTQEFINFDTLLMMINSTKITDNLALISEEFQALLSIERPILHVTLKNEELKTLFGYNTAYVKYPDEGFSILLCTELQKLGFEFIGYEDVDESCEADIVMDYDLEIEPQKDLRLFINKDIEFMAEGERVSFPSKMPFDKNILSVDDEYVGIPQGREIFFDKMEFFDTVAVEGVNAVEGTRERYHTKQKFVLKDEASFMSVIAEHKLFGVKCVGAYFDAIPSFLYYDGKNVVRAVPPKPFEPKNIISEIAALREGSDRLVENLKTKRPDIYEKLEALELREDVSLFEAAAIIFGLEDCSMRGIVKEAMKFVGKGGIQIDTHVTDNRFDNAAFLASIVSYQLAGVSTTILSYSMFESLGDYFNDILQELKAKTKAKEIVLCGVDFANQSLFSRMQRNLKMTPPYMNGLYPIGRESGIVGAAYL